MRRSYLSPHVQNHYDLAPSFFDESINPSYIIGDDPRGAGATTGTFGTVPAGDIVILAVPYSAVLNVVKQYGEALAGKLLVDITNPIKSDFTGFLTPEDSFGAREIAKVAPADAVIVK